MKGFCAMKKFLIFLSILCLVRFSLCMGSQRKIKKQPLKKGRSMRRVKESSFLPGKVITESLKKKVKSSFPFRRNSI